MSNIIYTNKSDIEKELKEITKHYSNICILVDENTKKYCLPLLFNTSFNIIEIKSGEEEKNLETCQFIWNRMTELNLVLLHIKEELILFKYLLLYYHKLMLV